MTARKVTRKAASKTKKATTRKPATSRTKNVAKKTIARNPIRKAWTKSEIFTGISDNTGLTRKDVSNVFSELECIIAQHMKGAGMFTLPGVMKILTKRKPATKARKGISPFSGEEMIFKAKPARTIVKIRALKKVKEMV